MLSFVHRVVAVVVCAPTFEHEAVVRTALHNGLFTFLINVFTLLRMSVVSCAGL